MRILHYSKGEQVYSIGTIFRQEKGYQMNTYTQLSQDERYTMCMFLAKGFTKAEVAQAMNRSISTIYRELDRNRRPDSRDAASVAHNFYRGRLRRS